MVDSTVRKRLRIGVREYTYKCLVSHVRNSVDEYRVVHPETDSQYDLIHISHWVNGSRARQKNEEYNTHELKDNTTN